MKPFTPIPRVTAVEVIRPHVVRVTFDDGLARDIEFTSGRAQRGGVFEPLEDPEYFSLVFVEPEASTIAWPNGLDLAPEVLHGDHDFPANGHFRHLGAPQPGCKPA